MTTTCKTEKFKFITPLDLAEKLISEKGKTVDFSFASPNAFESNAVYWYGAAVMEIFDGDVLTVGYYGGGKTEAIDLELLSDDTADFAQTTKVVAKYICAYATMFDCNLSGCETEKVICVEAEKAAKKPKLPTELCVTSQAELDLVPVDYCGKINVMFGIGSKPAIIKKEFENPCTILVGGKNAVVVSEKAKNSNLTIRASGGSHVRAGGKVKICAYNRATVEAGGAAYVNLHDFSVGCLSENSTGSAYNHAVLRLYDCSKGTAWENSTVFANDNAEVRIYENAAVHVSTKGGGKCTLVL